MFSRTPASIFLTASLAAILMTATGASYAQAQAELDVDPSFTDGNPKGGDTVNYFGTIKGLTPGQLYSVQISVVDGASNITDSVSYFVRADSVGNGTFDSFAKDDLGNTVRALKVFNPGNHKDPDAMVVFGIYNTNDQSVGDSTYLPIEVSPNPNM